ncbi:MAG: alanine racemase [Clostridia bacterium]|nr:alanine racemase [Clostridia bacterium]
MKSVRFPSQRAFARINTAAIDHNFRLMQTLARRQNPAAEVIAVVKANAYGHGVGAVLPPLLAAGCTRFAVATLQEALEVRQLAPESEVLILGYTPPTKLPEMAKKHLTQTVFSPEYARALARVAEAAGCRLSVHIKLNGGLCRAGLEPDPDPILRLLRQIGRPLSVTGLLTHFPSADLDPAGTRAALGRFLQCKKALNRAGFFPFCHAAASAAALTLPEAVLDAIRPGLALYGLSPVDTPLDLRPALSLYAPVVQLRSLSAGTAVGYGGDFVTARPSRIGTLPIGYADGVSRRLSGFSVTLLHGKARFSVPIVGRISMDQLTLDLTDTPAAIGDTVCLWQSANAPAAHCGTIPYEILTALSPRVRRTLL